MDEGDAPPRALMLNSPLSRLNPVRGGRRRNADAYCPGIPS